MKKHILILGIFIIFLCSGCVNSKSLECTMVQGNSTHKMKIENNKIISIIETTYETEEGAIQAEKYSKENLSTEVIREGNRVIDKTVSECDNSCEDAKETWEQMGFECK